MDKYFYSRTEIPHKKIIPPNGKMLQDVYADDIEAVEGLCKDLIMQSEIIHINAKVFDMGHRGRLNLLLGNGFTLDVK